MLVITFTVDDLARTRFALSPLSEVVASVRVLKSSRPPAIHRHWHGHLRSRLRSPDSGVRLLFDLVQPSSWYLPDFLSPAPRSPVPDLTAEIAGLRGLQPDQVRADLDVLGHALTHPVGSLDEVTRPRRRTRRTMIASPSALVSDLYADPAHGLGLLADGIAAYWKVAIEPWWGRIRATLESDLLYRGRQLGQGGHALLFGVLAPEVSWRDGALHIRHRRFSGRRDLYGEGLLLMPSAFVWPSLVSSTIPPWQPSLTYPARGVGSIWQSAQPSSSEAVGRVIGRSRARILAQLETPTSTTDLAALTGLTPGGVSQHLTAMHNAGLVAAHRVGRVVLYSRTAIAEALLAQGNGVMD
jgi:DNA-binding transcriptional ArsR family regulator